MLSVLHENPLAGITRTMNTYAVSTIWTKPTATGSQTRHRLRIIQSIDAQRAFAVVYDWHTEEEMQDFSLVSKLVVDTAILEANETEQAD